MKSSTILSVLIWALVLTALALLSSCAKERNSNPFKIYYYTTNRQMPKLYLVQNKKTLGKVPYLATDPEKLDTAQLLCATSYDISTEILGVDTRGIVIETFNYTLHNDGSYKEGGGGYLLYESFQKEPYTLLVKINGQF
jgi:hypothetical protein